MSWGIRGRPGWWERVLRWRAWRGLLGREMSLDVTFDRQLVMKRTQCCSTLRIWNRYDPITLRDLDIHYLLRRLTELITCPTKADVDVGIFHLRLSLSSPS